MSAWICLTLCLLQPPAGDVHAELEAATRKALSQIAPTVVQVRTVGGAEFIGKREGTVQRGTGPTTGTIVSADGYILSSSFNFANKPAAITVMIPGRKDPLAAKVIAEDQTRMLTLLKVEATGLPVPAVAPQKELKIGQWAMAVGRTWSDSQNTMPSASVGIISALDRVWGKALQTDAKVSPVNYGGPLVDLQGRVIGILVPLAPRGESETAGVEWYDSGIGFAVPFDDVQAVLPKLKQGKTLQKGRMGVIMKNEDPIMTESEITSVTLESPASKLGIKPGDKIVSVDGKPIKNQAQFLHAMGPKYEGDTISLKIKRGEEILSFESVTLAGQPASHVHAYLGILPVRDDNENGVLVRYVYPESPAAKAGIEPGDRIMRMDNVPISDRNLLLALMNRMLPGMQTKLVVKKPKESKTLTVALASLDDALPVGELPVGTAKKALEQRKPLPGESPAPGKAPSKRPAEKAPPSKTVPAAKPKTGYYEVNDTTSGRSSWYYVPEDYDPNISYGVVLWLHPAGDAMMEGMLSVWKPICNQHHLILMAPRAENQQGWMTSESDQIQSELRALLNQYTIDRQRIVAHGLRQGAQFALYMGFDAREMIRGVASVGGSLAQPPKENVDQQRLSFFLVAGERDPQIEAIRAVPGKLKENRYPVNYFELTGQGNGYITDVNVFEQLIHWIIGLDRL
ncbi:MAG: PDZ domain-containing protein [Planctomycetia bacterium]|nr:PDZ domain-containing protein [Planctomycetia bacterium]